MDTNQKIPGSNLIFISGILYLVFAFFNVIASLSGIMLANFWDQELPIATSWLTFYAVSLISSFLISVPVGIIGIAYCEKPENMGFVQFAACICIIRTIALLVLSFSFTLDASSIATLINLFTFRFIVPTLYLVGVRNAKVYLRSGGNTYPGRR